MKLKSMQLIGFKSFAEKTTIDFKTGLTAIVGPNGSGKSNVIEAIRWVLGEQSAKNLRSTKMADVIFSGSKNHRALNRAEVTLTFDNTDHYLDINYTEVTVTRKLFRNGDSFYYLNHHECRLKDINDLLMDTGIGRGSFSIISQGNVEAIFNSKPEDRRNIIETTAGIYKYRQRKQVADQRLNETNANLARVNDIILELKTQVTDLKQQSQAAESYQKLQLALGQWHYKQLALNAQRLATDYEQTQSKLDGAKQQVEQLTNNITELREQKKQYQDQIDRLVTINDQSQTKLLAATNQIEKYDSQQKLAVQQSDFKTEQLQTTKEQLSTLVDQYSTTDDQIRRVDDQIAVYQAQLTSFDQTSIVDDSAKMERQIEAAEAMLADLRGQYLDLLQHSSDLTNKINYTDKDNVQFNAQTQSIHQRIENNQQTITAVSKANAKLKVQQQDINTELNALNEQQRQRDAQQTKLETEVDQQQRQWYSLLRKEQQLTAKLNGLVEFQNSHSGYFTGSKNLLAHQNELTGIRGSVADHIEVTEKYVTAIETALGSRLQQIMVQDTSSARAAIQFMTQRRLGRVTLLPIDNLAQRSINDTILNKLSSMNGFIAIAAQLVKMATPYLQVKEYLLGNIIIATDLHAATAIGDLLHHRYRIVTLDGQVVNAGGSITGGANKREVNGMLVQKERIQKLRITGQATHDQITQLESKLKKKQALLKTVNADQQASQQQQTELKQTFQLLSAELTQNDKVIHDKQRESASQRIQLKTLAQDHAQETSADLTAQLTKVNASIETNQNQVMDVQKTLTDLKKKRARLNEEQRTEHEQVVLLQVELKHAKNQREDLAQNLAKNQQQQIKVNQSIQKINDQLTGKVTNANLNARIGLLKREVVDIKRRLTNNKQRLTQLKSLVKPLENKIDQHQDELMLIQNKDTQLNGAIDQITEQLHSIKIAAQQKYALGVNELLTLEVKTEPSLINNHLNQIKRQISALGPVNINSIDRFKEVNERYQFLNQQADDLIRSKHQLEQTMAEMDTEVKQRFKQTFETLQDAFQQTFKEIFGGGDAKLKLTDSSHLLTTGIDIMAQPPGKRFRNMTLLSGGERSLTAIALLFAVLKLQPVPFCILDEAESALDPANVDRFAGYIQRLKPQTQFIVITHRKETMVYADNLYGVTMQDSGISKVLAVDLKQAQTTKG